jgi:hypothetical protein
LLTNVRSTQPKRTQARGKFKKGTQITPGLVSRDDWQAWLRMKGVTVIGGDVDEAPQAYRSLPDVLQAHAGTVQILAHAAAVRGRHGWLERKSSTHTRTECRRLGGLRINAVLSG